jgi:hypothetical protein
LERPPRTLPATTDGLLSGRVRQRSQNAAIHRQQSRIRPRSTLAAYRRRQNSVVRRPTSPLRGSLGFDCGGRGRRCPRMFATRAHCGSPPRQHRGDRAPVDCRLRGLIQPAVQPAIQALARRCGATRLQRRHGCQRRLKPPVAWAHSWTVADSGRRSSVSAVEPVTRRWLRGRPARETLVRLVI